MKLTPIFATTLLMASSSLLAQEADDSRTISVAGTAEKSVPADQVEISVQIRSVRKSLPEAQEASKEVFSSVVKKLGELTIPEEKLELQNHYLGREYQNGPNGQRIDAGFYSERSFRIELDDVSLLESVYEELAQNPDLRVGNTAFSRTDEIEIRKELRTKALAAAKEKATEMAAVYELFLGDAMKITEAGGGGGPMPYNTRNVMAMEAGSRVEGKVSLSASVNVVFELTD